MEYIRILIEIIRYDCIKQVAHGQSPHKQDFLAMNNLRHSSYNRMKWVKKVASAFELCCDLHGLKRKNPF